MGSLSSNNITIVLLKYIKHAALKRRLAATGKKAGYGIFTLYDNFYSKKFLLRSQESKPHFGYPKALSGL